MTQDQVVTFFNAAQKNSARIASEHGFDKFEVAGFAIRRITQEEVGPHTDVLNTRTCWAFDVMMYLGEPWTFEKVPFFIVSEAESHEDMCAIFAEELAYDEAQAKIEASSSGE